MSQASGRGQPVYTISRQTSRVRPGRSWTVIIRSGARFGPRKIREASLMLWGHNQALKVAPTKALTVVDYGDVAAVPESIDSTMQAITAEVSALLDQRLPVVALGGDHSVSLIFGSSGSPATGCSSAPSNALRERPS